MNIKTNSKTSNTYYVSILYPFILSNELFNLCLYYKINKYVNVN